MGHAILGHAILGHVSPFLGQASAALGARVVRSWGARVRSWVRVCALGARVSGPGARADWYTPPARRSPASSSWNIGCGERRFRLCGIPHRAALAAHGAARPHAADPDDRAYREAGQREGGGHHQKQLLQRCGRLCRRRVRCGDGRNLIYRGLLHFLGLRRLGCRRVGGGDLEIGWSCQRRSWWERRSIASTTAAPARARSAWLRAGYSARPVRGGRRSRSLDSGGRIWLGAGLLGDPFGTRVGDRLARDRSLLRRRRLLCCRSCGWRRCGAEAGGAARANLSSAVSLSSRRYQH